MSSINDIFSKVQNMLGMGLGILCYILTEVKVNFVRSRASFVEARIQLR